MKKSELKKIIKEQIRLVLKEDSRGGYDPTPSFPKSYNFNEKLETFVHDFVDEQVGIDQYPEYYNYNVDSRAGDIIINVHATGKDMPKDLDLTQDMKDFAESMIQELKNKFNKQFTLMSVSKKGFELSENLD